MKRRLMMVGIVAVMLVGAYVTAYSFFTYQDLYEIISSYERIDNVNDSATLEGMNGIPEVKEFLAKHSNTNKRIFVEFDPIFTTIHASGGYTGEYLKMYYFFNQPLHVTYGCWTDNGNASDMLFTSEIRDHIRDDSCMDHFVPSRSP